MHYFLGIQSKNIALYSIPNVITIRFLYFKYSQINGKSIYRFFLKIKMGVALGLATLGSYYGSFKKYYGQVRLR